jgi:UPF0716 protein FxsA
VATGLVLVPGLVTTVLGMLLLLPPVRAAAGPGLTNIALRGLRRRAPLVSYSTTFTDFRHQSASDGADYIDGGVIDVHDFEPAALPKDALPKDRPADEHWGGPRFAPGSN